MKKTRKILAITMAIMIVLAITAISVFARTEVHLNDAGGYPLHGYISGDASYAEADTYYDAPANRAITATSLYQIYTDGGGDWLSTGYGACDSGTSSYSTGASNIDHLEADHNYGLDGYYLGSVSTWTE